jgi:hypothetical protein
MSPATTEPAEEHLAQNKESERLPKGDCVPSKQPRHQPVPQAHNDEAQECASNRRQQGKLDSTHHPISSHFIVLILS